MVAQFIMGLCGSEDWYSWRRACICRWELENGVVVVIEYTLRIFIMSICILLVYPPLLSESHHSEPPFVPICHDRCSSSPLHSNHCPTSQTISCVPKSVITRNEASSLLGCSRYGKPHLGFAGSVLLLLTVCSDLTGDFLWLAYPSQILNRVDSVKGALVRIDSDLWCWMVLISIFL